MDTWFECSFDRDSVHPHLVDDSHGDAREGRFLVFNRDPSHATPQIDWDSSRGEMIPIDRDVRSCRTGRVAEVDMGNYF